MKAISGKSDFHSSKKYFPAPLLDHLPISAWIVEPGSFRIRYANEKAVQVYGYSIEEFLSLNYLDLFTLSDRIKFSNKTGQVIKQSAPWSTQQKHLKKNCEIINVELHCSALEHEGSQFLQITAIESIDQKDKQLRLHTTVLENVSDIVVTTDLNFKVKTWNKVAEQYYGIAEFEAIGKSMGSLVHFTFYNTTREQALIDLKEKGIWNNIVSIQSINSDTLYFDHTVKFMYDESGNKIGILSVGRDITDRRRAENKLLKSERFYRALFADALDGNLLVDVNGKITFTSPSVKNVLGYEVEDIIGKNAFEFVHPDDLHRAFDSFQKEVIENPEIKSIVIRLLKKNGEWLWCMVRGHNLFKNPDVNSLVIYFHDDTLRKQASDALKESERRFRNLIREMAVGVSLHDKEGRIILCNDAYTNILLTKEEELIGKKLYDIAVDAIDENGRKFNQEERPLLRSLLTKKPSKNVVIRIYRPKTNDHVWLLINTDPILDEKGEIIHVICSTMDITERKKLEGELLTKQINHQKQLTQASIDGQEKERLEIGKELHDNIGQRLTTVKLFLDMAKSIANEQAVEMVGLALNGVSDVINEVRSISRTLVPSTLKDLGLIESIIELSGSIERTQLLKIEVDSFDFEEKRLPENQKLMLFRIVQEQLNNIVKHANASTVSIDLKNNDQGLSLKIKDDGKGFNPDKVRKGLGFMNIKNRAELFGGYAEVISQPGLGCSLSVFIPWNRECKIEN